MKFNFLNLKTRTSVGLILLGVALLGISVQLLSKSETHPTTPIVPPVSETVLAAESEKRIDLMLTATLRAMGITDACYSNDMFFVRMGDHTPDEKFYDAGWWMFDSYKFAELSNGTLVLTDNAPLIRVEPDVTGLTCKQQANDPTWFK